VLLGLFVHQAPYYKQFKLNNMITFKTFVKNKTPFTGLIQYTKHLFTTGLICIIATGVWGQASVNRLSVVQYNRVDTKGKMIFANSSLAAIRFNAIPDATQTYYLNIVAKGVNNSAIWVVKNFPVFSKLDNYSESIRQLELDFKSLNIEPGKAVRSVNLFSTLSTELATRIPTGTFYSLPVTVESFSNESTSYYEETSSYAGYTGTTAPADVNIHNDGFPSVQEHYYGCTPGSFARSIAWLISKYNLGCTLTAQQIYAILHFKTMLSNPGLNYDTSVARKARFLDSIARAGGKTGKTEFMDKGNMLKPLPVVAIVKDDTVKFFDDLSQEFDSDIAMAPSTPSTGGGGNLAEIPSSNGETWLKDNLSGNDVELHFDNHMITVTGMTCSGGVCTFTYRDDEHQDSTGGDTGEKTGEIKGDSVKINGTWYKIEVLFKESIGPAANRVAAISYQDVDLLPNRPNPFNGSTTIGINVKNAFQYNNAELVIRDMNGGLVQRIKLKLKLGLNEVQYNVRRGEKGGLIYTLEVDGKPLQSRQMYIQQEP
jgi:hypothetical protein